MTVDVEEIKAANPLVETVTRLTGQPIVRHKIKAPWRNEDTPSLHVYEDGSWWDYGSGVGGDVLDFVGYFYFGTAYNPHVHFTEVIDRLGSLGIRPLPAQTTKPKPAPQRTFAISLDEIMLWHDEMPDNRRAYWHSRGLADHTIDAFLLGWDGRRYTIPHLYRYIPFGIKRRISDIDDGVREKYVSVTGSRMGIFNGDALWEAESAVICEGEIDCMLLYQAGHHAVSTTAGANSWKPEWAKLFSHVRKLWIVYDNDEAGRKGAQKVQATLRRARIVTLPEGIKDVGELMGQHSQPVAWLAGALA